MHSLDTISTLTNQALNKFKKNKIKRTKEAIKNCGNVAIEVRLLIRYTKPDQSLLAGKKFGGLLDKETIMNALAILVIEKELLDGECEEHKFD